MEDDYLPPSDFLRGIVKEEVSLTDGAFAEVNLQRLITMTADADDANRDWATMLLAQLELNRSDVRDALILAASDKADIVRGEAILGLAMLDRQIALTFLQKELSGSSVTLPLIEAATLVADPTLVEPLEAFAEQSEETLLDRLILEALSACRANV